MADDTVEDTRSNFVYTGTVSRNVIGSRWSVVERVATALADDPVAGTLPANISIREPNGEFTVDNLSALVAAAAQHGRPFDVVDACLRQRPIEIRMLVYTRWFGARLDFVCRSSRRAEALGMSELVQRQLGRAGVRRIGRNKRGRLARLHQAPWFIGFATMALGLALAQLLSR